MIRLVLLAVVETAVLFGIGLALALITLLLGCEPEHKPATFEFECAPGAEPLTRAENNAVYICEREHHCYGDYVAPCVHYLVLEPADSLALCAFCYEGVGCIDLDDCLEECP